MISTVTRIAAALLAFGCMACSSSEDTASSKPPETPREFSRTDSAVTVADRSERAVQKDDVPSVERYAPAEDSARETERAEQEHPQQGNAQDASRAPVQDASRSTREGLMMWSVQIGAFKLESGALQLFDRVKGTFSQPVYKDYDPATGFYKVTVGSFPSKDAANTFKGEVQSKGYPDAFTVEVRR
jgi:cell division septation protein DedD